MHQSNITYPWVKKRKKGSNYLAEYRYKIRIKRNIPLGMKKAMSHTWIISITILGLTPLAEKDQRMAIFDIASDSQERHLPDMIGHHPICN